MADQFTYYGALETLKSKLQWEDKSLTEIEERFRLMGILYYASATINHFEQAIKRAEQSIIVRDLADVDFDYWTNINNWDVPGWLTNEDLKEAHLWRAWNIHNNSGYIDAKLANSITGLLPAAPKMEEYDDVVARNDMNKFLQLFQGVYFNSHQLRTAIYQAIEALIQTLIQLRDVLYQQRTDKEYEEWYDDLWLEFSSKLVSNITKSYAYAYNQRLTGPNRDWLLERFGDAAIKFWDTPYMQARKDACTNQECKNQTIFFEIPTLSKDQQRKFFHVLLEIGTFDDKGYHIDKKANAGKCLYLLYLENIQEQAILEFFTFLITAQIISSDLVKFPQEQKTQRTKAPIQQDVAYMTFKLNGGITMGHIELLRQKLCKVGWIPDDTQPDDFTNLFTGKSNNTKVKWLIGVGNLVFLFQVMEEQHKIIVPDNFTRNQILEHHFTDKDGKYLSGLHSGKVAKKCQPIVVECFNILQIDQPDFD